MPDLITPAVPVFFLLIAIELVVAWVTRRSLYRLNDAVASLSCGVTMQVLEAFLKLWPILAYIAAYEHFRLASLPATSPWVWVAAFFAVDFAYYWFHRVSHTVNLFWGAHIPHHHSEAFNFTTALRQGAFEAYFAMAFYLWLAIAGFPIEVFLICKQAMTLFQFLLHTRAVGRMGPLEWFMNTPSHHRVHHGQNPQYLDKNYGGWLIVWDKVFGTFAPEQEDVVYGTVKPLATWNPLWANLHHWYDVAKASTTMSLKDGLLLWLRPPGWTPQGVLLPTETPVITFYDPRVSSRVKAYALALFVLATAGFLVGAPMLAGWGMAERVMWGLSVFSTLVAIGIVLDARAWAVPFELGRWVAIGGAIGAWPGLPLAGRLGGVAACGAMVVFCWLAHFAVAVNPVDDQLAA